MRRGGETFMVCLWKEDNHTIIPTARFVLFGLSRTGAAPGPNLFVWRDSKLIAFFIFCSVSDSTAHWSCISFDVLFEARWNQVFLTGGTLCLMQFTNLVN